MLFDIKKEQDKTLKNKYTNFIKVHCANLVKSKSFSQICESQ